MSYETWRQEFYPITARELMESDPSDVVLVEHAIRKWTGLLKENLNKHAVADVGMFAPKVVDRDNHAGRNLTFSLDSCSLCIRYNHGTSSWCDGCPLNEYEGDLRCSDEEDGDGDLVLSAYLTVCDDPTEENVLAMIEALKGALVIAKKRETKR